MVWYGGLEPPVVLTSWDLLRVALGGALVWQCGGGAGCTEESTGRHPLCYLPLGHFVIIDCNYLVFYSINNPVSLNIHNI